MRFKSKGNPLVVVSNLYLSWTMVGALLGATGLFTAQCVVNAISEEVQTEDARGAGPGVPGIPNPPQPPSGGGAVRP